jgi:hypothetical protein
MDILKDEGAFNNLICLIVIVGVIVVLIVESFNKDKDHDL